jgi:uncharacterized protein (DUF2384 family)
VRTGSRVIERRFKLYFGPKNAELKPETTTMPASPQRLKIPIKSKDEVLNYAREVFGDPRKAFSWLTSPNQVFQGMRPKDVIELGKAEDIYNVFNELERIDHGLF